MIDPLFTLYCEDCEVAERPSRLWIRAEIETSVSDGGGSGGLGHPGGSESGAVETHHYIECMNCGSRFKSCMEDHMEAVGDDEWSRFVEEASPADAGGAADPASSQPEGTAR